MEKENKVQVVFDVFVGDPVMFDQLAFSAWCQGYSVSEAAKRRFTKQSDKKNESEGLALVLRDTQDQYRNFQLLKRYLNEPQGMSSQSLFQLAPSLQNVLINKYYETDEVVARDVIGRKLKSSARKEVEEEAESFKIRLLSLRRQFDNIRRVYKKVTNMDGNITDLIIQNFKLDPPLAQKYARLIFLCYHRFEVEKKNIKNFSWNDLEAMASHLMEWWTITSVHPQEDQRVIGIHLDREFVEGIRDLKAIFLSEKEISSKYKGLVLAAFPNAKLIEGKFSSLVKWFLVLGAKISVPKEFRNFFLDLTDDFHEIFFKLKEPDINELLTTMTMNMEATFSSLKHRERHSRTWKRFIEGMRPCILLLLSRKLVAQH